MNEHFLALKTKYTNEKDHFDSIITNMENEINRIVEDNKKYSLDIEQSSNNYYRISQYSNNYDDEFNQKQYELNQKLINEKNLILLNNKEKELNNKYLYQINSNNAHLMRTIEKNNLFKEDKSEKNKVLKEKRIEKFKEIDRLVERSLLEEEGIKKKFEKTSQSKIFEEENSQMMMNVNKLDRELHMSQAKITELENMRELNLKYIRDEALNRKIHEKENIKLNDELENLGKLNEENLRIKVKENEQKQLLIIRNQIKNSEHKMNTFLNHYKEAEKEARDLLEEKNITQQKLAQLIEETDSQFGLEHQQKDKIINLSNEIDELELQSRDNLIKVEHTEQENLNLITNNDKLESEIKNNRIKLDEIVQRIELNNILKDVDINELKMLTQNNAVVNNSINSLMIKWDKVHTKLKEIEDKQKNAEVLSENTNKN